MKKVESRQGGRLCVEREVALMKIEGGGAWLGVGWRRKAAQCSNQGWEKGKQERVAGAEVCRAKGAGLWCWESETRTSIEGDA